MHLLRKDLAARARTQEMRRESGWRFGLHASAALLALSVGTGCGTERQEVDEDSSTEGPNGDGGVVLVRDAQSPASDAGDHDANSAHDAGQPDAGDPLDLKLSNTEGAAPLWMEATPPASSAEHPYVVRYDWGEGAGPEAKNSHYYLQPGDFTVTQEVRDATTGTIIDTTSEQVRVVKFEPVRWSATDKSACSHVSSDGYSV